MALLSIFVGTACIAVQQYMGQAANIVQVNDNDLGTGLNQFEYIGTWEYDSAVSGAFNTDNHASFTAEDYYQVRFSGTQIKIYGEKNVAMGQAAISIDGGSEAIINPYSSTHLEQQLLYASATLANGNHILKVRNTGEKDQASAGTWVSADRVDVIADPIIPPAPTVPPSTPMPTVKPVATTSPSVVHASVPTPRTAAQQLAAPQAPSAQVMQDTVPTMPSNLSALVTGDNAIVTLRWSASESGTGISGYRVERLSDGADWTTLSDKVTELTYLDRAAAFSVHYKYRLSAISGTGKVSDYATVDATTGNFIATSVTTTSGSFRSDDKSASAEVPAGALATNANCSVITMAAKVATSALKVVAGSYSLVCKDASGKVLTDFAQPIKWSVNLKGKLRGVSNPDAAVIDSTTGAAASIPGAVYDPKAQVMNFNQTSSSTVAVLGEVKHGTSWIWITFVIIMLLAGGGFIFLLRHHQIEKYRDYLMAKYYNL
ncbi:MAG: hypothetical protein NVSMB39_6630 [Candidatus Saccharimonadales bacterium]